ncbi:MAG: HlyD family type I secretion periplasmic adaptor subunit, partial [Pseudomonadota bacterium]
MREPAVRELAVREFLGDAAAIEERPLPVWGRGTLYVVVALFAAAIAWGVLSHMDRIVVAQGRLVTIEPHILLQPLETSVIRAIDVRVGQVVKAGDVVARLDPTFVEADVAELSAQVASRDAALRRLEREIAGEPFAPAPGNPDEALQFAIFSQRKAEYEARTKSFESAAQRLTAALETNRQRQAGLRERVGLYRDIEAMRTELLSRNVGSRLQVLEARRDALALNDELDAQANAERELRHQLEEALENAKSFASEWRRKSSEEYVTTKRERDGLDERLAKALKRGTLVVLKAPADSVVLDVAKRSIGSVLREAEPLVTLVRLDTPVEAEVEIEAKDVG